MALPFANLFRRAPALTWIEIDDLRRRRDAGEAILLIDVREPEEFDAPPGHLPDARNIPLGALPAHIDDIRGHHLPVVLVCKTDRRSARAAASLMTAGLSDVAVLREGTDGWHARGLALT